MGSSFVRKTSRLIFHVAESKVAVDARCDLFQSLWDDAGDALTIDTKPDMVGIELGMGLPAMVVLLFESILKRFNVHQSGVRLGSDLNEFWINRRVRRRG